MNFFEFESQEIIDDGAYLRLHVEPMGEKYQYSIIFESDKNHTLISGIANTPLLALVKLRNALVSTIDTLTDLVDMTKAAASHVALNELNDEDEEDQADAV